MSVDAPADDGAARAPGTLDTLPAVEPPDRVRPNVSGDLATVFQAAPMFRRAVAGYDRFQVDTYVRWAEDELATADREREHLVARLLRTRAELEEARQLLVRSPGGADFLQLSRRMGSMLAAAADEAESLRTDAEADRAAASAQAERTIADAQRVLAEADAEAERRTAAMAMAIVQMTAAAGRIVDAAEQAGSEIRAEAAARLEEVRALEQRAAEDAGRIRREAEAQAEAARLHARDEVVRMLATGREERRRADVEAVVARGRRERDAEARAAFLLGEVDVLERRRSSLRAEIQVLARQVAAPVHPLDSPLRRQLDKLRWRLRSVRTP